MFFADYLPNCPINSHTNVPTRSGQLGTWVNTQRRAFRLLIEGKCSTLTIDRCKQLENNGFDFKCRLHWDQRFQVLVEFKKIIGYTNVPRRSRPFLKLH
jgi:hypothetical protein